MAEQHAPHVDGHHEDDHGEHHHDHHPLPPPEPDEVAFVPVFLWGFGMFIGLVICIFILGGYFWMEVEDTHQMKADQASILGHGGLAELRARDSERLAGRGAEGADKRIPITEAIEQVASEAARRPGIERGVPAVPAPAPGVAPAPPIEAPQGAVPAPADGVPPGAVPAPADGVPPGAVPAPAEGMPPGAVPADGVPPGAVPAPTDGVAPVAGEVVPPGAVAAPTPDAPAAPADPALVEKGKALFTAKTCNACHSIDGQRLVGPTLKGAFGRIAELEDGTSVKFDSAYFKRSILEPVAQVSKGYPPAMPVMPVTDDEIAALEAYVRSL